MRYRGGWLPVNRLARSREELEEFGRSLDQAMRQGQGLAFWGEKALRAKGELLLVCIECGAALAEVQGRCLQCATGGIAGGEPHGRHEMQTAAARPQGGFFPNPFPGRA